MIEALYAFSTFAGACLVLAVAGVIFFGLVCWARDMKLEREARKALDDKR